MTNDWIRGGRHMLTLGAASVLLGFSSTASAARMPDAWITTKVKIALLTTKGVSASEVNVDTVDGRVTLHGIVRSDAEKAKAAAVARDVQGTRDVRNLLQVVKQSAQRELAVSDAELKARVTTALDKDPALADSAISVASVNKGVVLLAGSARTLSDTLRAIEIASAVEGVRRVASEIASPDTLGDAEVWRDGKYDTGAAARSTASDMWTTTEVKLRLLANSQTPSFDINVDTDGGVVTLFGVVDSQATKDAAGAEVRKVAGVLSVVNELQIVPTSVRAKVADSDASIEDAVIRRLGANPRLKGTDIDVDVKNGVARLTGSVESQSDRITALTVTRATTGVRGLVDDLKVVPPSVSAS
jgi:osmotically-inducible protein OsmY